MNDVSTIIRNIGDLFVYHEGSPLLFSSGLFWVMFLIFIPIFASLRRDRWQMMLFVVLFSLFFYYKSSGVFVVMLLATSVLDWLLSRSIASTHVKWQRRASLALSLMFSLGVLAYFKYAHPAMWSWNNMVEGNFQPTDLVIPVGLSFYTFQSASYIIDVYRGKVSPTDTWLEYAFFLTFFPALVAGPIVRADYFLPQIHDREHPNRTEMYAGLWLVIIGVLKKALIADYLAQYNDLIFDNPGNYSGFETLMGTLGYVMQIYCDFSGYSDMAIGLALIMGFRLQKNFDFPYKSKNIGEFWHRWHISLSSWMRDYIYIPLGGSRRGTLRTYANNLVTMLFAGLWHGVGWKFIFWGGIHGVALVTHRMFRPVLSRIPDVWWVKALSWTLTMAFLIVTFIFFRAPSVHASEEILHAIFTDFSLAYILPFITTRTIWVVMLLVIIIAHSLPTSFWDKASFWFINTPWIVKLAVLIISIQLIIELRSADVVPFIYFQF